jgi:hypothetical protein
VPSTTSAARPQVSAVVRWARGFRSARIKGHSTRIGVVQKGLFFDAEINQSVPPLTELGLRSACAPDLRWSTCVEHVPRTDRHLSPGSPSSLTFPHWFPNADNLTYRLTRVDHRRYRFIP